MRASDDPTRLGARVINGIGFNEVTILGCLFIIERMKTK